MKHKLKKILLLYLFTGTLFVSCTMEEDAIRKHNYSKDIKIYQKSFDELMKDSKFSTSFNKLPKKKSVLNSSTQARTVMEEQYGFTITNTPARVMQVGSITSYTFHIERENNNPSFFENLVVQNDSVGNTTAHIIKYTPFMPMTAYPEHNSYSFEGETEFTSIIYDDTQVNTTGRMVTVCRNLYSTRCNANSSGACVATSHIPMAICLTQSCMYQQFLTETCTTYDDGQPEDGTGGGGTGGGTGTGGGGGTDPIYSDPVCIDCFEDTPETIDTEPCNELKRLSLNTSVSNALKDTKGFAQSSSVERGFSIRKNILSETVTYPYPAMFGTPTSIRVKFVESQYGSIHIHPISAYYMFSPADIYGLYELSQGYNTNIDTSATQDLYVNIMVTPDYDYAIKIDDSTKLATVVEYCNTPEKRLDFDKKFKSFIENKCKETQCYNTTFEKIFLDFINSSHDYHTGLGNHDFGISLYRRDNSTESKINSDWIKLELDSSGEIKKLPCKK